jgi:hydroxymethylglutaryl-CoA lyase
LSEVCRIKGDTKVGLAIATAFICPWTGRVPPENVVKIIEYGLSVGVTEFGLGDTIGAAHPRQIAEMITLLKTKLPKASPILHLHDTRGMGLANVLAALQAGATRFETSVGGLGGCPFAPGASGNIATEDLVNMLGGMGVSSGINLEKLMKTVYRVQELLPVPISSHMATALTCEVR